jgi:hypothetical protein
LLKRGEGSGLNKPFFAQTPKEINWRKIWESNKIRFAN